LKIVLKTSASEKLDFLSDRQVMTSFKHIFTDITTNENIRELNEKSILLNYSLPYVMGWSIRLLSFSEKCEHDNI
jgi:hypothetical protein